MALRKLTLATGSLISQKTLPLHYSRVVFITASHVIWRMSPFDHGRKAVPTESKVDWRTSSWKACIDYCILYMPGNITTRDWKTSISN